MENNLNVIDERLVLGKDFKIYGSYENPLFLASDVANFIDHFKPSRMINMVESYEKVKKPIIFAGQSREMWFLTEGGLYEVLMQSKKPIAKAFKKEVKNILIDIRKHGIYANQNIVEHMISNPDDASKIFQEIHNRNNKIKTLETLIKNQKPKVIFSDAVSNANTTILVGQLAKLIRQNGVEIGQNRLFKWLRENGYLMKRKGISYNTPTQKAMEMDLFKVKESIYFKEEGEVKIVKTTMVTGKGQIYFVNKFLA